MTPSTRGLVAVTRALDAPVDLLAFAGDDGMVWARDGAGLAGRGDAARIEVPRGDPALAAAAVREALGGMEVDDPLGTPGSGPIALGALPFDPAEPGWLVVPELVVGHAGGRWWTTAISLAGAEPALPLVTSRQPASAATRYVVTSERSPSEWCEAVASARDSLRDGEADKVVLARSVEVEADAALSRSAVLSRLATAYPSCMLYAVDGLVGASPELLVSRIGSVVRSHPMAGTAPRSGDPEVDARLADDLLASAKDQAEHRITIDMVHDTLLPWCSYLDEEAEASVVAMANVAHLATYVEGQLSSPPASVMELVTALHPTPAVCGFPRDAALELIGKHEQLDRGRYAGPVGWVDADGNGEWAVGIRCAQIEGNRARLFAGVGVMPDSDPAGELAETQAKLQALLAAIIRP